MTLRVQNPGDTPFTFEEALHTYFEIGDVRRASIVGLEQTAYIDKVANFAEKRQGDAPVTLVGETDRIYLNTRAACTIHDPTWNRQTTVAKENSEDTVVWNPWADKAKAMADFGDDEWPHTVCVETCNVRDAKITLAPGKAHEMRAVIRV
jgi:D-hexose-6-phosphate mutarotase